MGKQRYFDDISDVDIYKNLGVKNPFIKSKDSSAKPTEDLTGVDIYKNLGLKPGAKMDTKVPEPPVSNVEDHNKADLPPVEVKSGFTPSIAARSLNIPTEEEVHQKEVKDFKANAEQEKLGNLSQARLPEDFLNKSPFIIKDLPTGGESTRQNTSQDVLTFDEMDKLAKTQMSDKDKRDRLEKSLQDYQEGQTVFGIPNTVVKGVEDINHPENMSPEFADEYYKDAAKQSIGVNIAGERVTPQKLMAGAYKFIPSFVKNFIEPVLKSEFPEQYRFLKADQIRMSREAPQDPEKIKDFDPELYDDLKKSGKIDQMKENYETFKLRHKLEGISDYGANMIGELAGLFSFAGPIHEGYNTMGVIGRLAAKNPRVATAISSFLAGGTYSGLTSAPKVASGEQGVGSAAAEAIATGIVFSAFSQVGTKDYMNLYKSGSAEEVYTYAKTKGGYALTQMKLQAIKGKEKEYLARSIANWLIDTGKVTGISDVTGKVAAAVDQSERNGTPITKEIQNQFKLDPAKLGLEYLINGMFTGGIPRQYQLPRTPLGPESQMGGERMSPEQRDYLKLEPKRDMPPPKEATTPEPPVKPPVETKPIYPRNPR